MCNKGHLGPNIKWKGTENRNPIGIEPVISWKLVLTCEQITEPLSPDSDQDQFSPNNIHMLPREMVMRGNKMIT